MVNLLSGLSGARPVCHTRRMSTPPTDRSTPHRFPAEVISPGVRLDYRCCRSYRGVEELLCARGVLMTDGAIRTRARKSDERRPISDGAGVPVRAASGT
jgi:hypothetical protein